MTPASRGLSCVGAACPSPPPSITLVPKAPTPSSRFPWGQPCSLHQR